MRAFHYLIPAIALMTIGAQAQAQSATFTDPSAFYAAVQSATIADFDDLSDAFYGGPGYGDGTGTVTYNGITVSTSTSYLFSSADNSYGTGTNLSAQQFSPTVVTLSFSNPSTALGFDYVAGTALVLTVAGQTFTIAASPFPTLGFFGLTTDTAFTSATLSTSGSGIDLDNIVFGEVATPVPEPAAWAMTIAGVGLVGGAMRRRARGRGTAAAA